MGISLCKDRPGVDRKVTQEQLAHHIVDFIRADLRVFVPQQVGTAPERKYHQRSIITEILINTPQWVFGLLAALIVFGIMQARTRKLRIETALIMPLVMLAFSLNGIVRFIGWQFSALACWFLGISLVTALLVFFMKRDFVHSDRENRKLVVHGSWLPLLVILAIFFTRYALGVANGMDLAIIHERYFLVVPALVLGGLSGFFLARGIVFWLTHKKH